MKKISIHFTLVFLLIAFKSFSQNPRLKDFADPALREHNGIMYLLVGKDLNLTDLKANAILNFSLYSKIGGGKIEVRMDSPSGKLLGTCTISKTGTVISYQTISCKLDNKAVNNNLYFVFKGRKMI